MLVRFNPVLFCLVLKVRNLECKDLWLKNLWKEVLSLPNHQDFDREENLRIECIKNKDEKALKHLKEDKAIGFN